MKFIVGTKKGMTQVFDENGIVHPVTVIAAPKVTVTQVKTPATDGYTAVQIGYGTQKESRIRKPQRTKGLFRGLKEFRFDDAGTLEMGAVVEASVFAEGDSVTVSAISKAKGFQGVVKRYGFKGGPRSHGQKHSERERGSSGGGPGRAGGRVVKGMRMAGRMGGDRVTVSNLKIVRVDGDDIFIEGAVPGRAGTVVEIRGK
jgi:large subunit ribosomal protein L3